MASISSTGIGSGIDIAGLVNSLVANEGEAKFNRLARREALYTAKLSSLGILKGAVSDFQSSYSALKSISTFNSLSAKSSDSSVFTVSAEKTAAIGSYDIDVANLAVAQKLQTATGFADSNTTSIGTGTLSFAFKSDIDAGNGVTKDITITDGTLKGIRDAINDADIGVNANIVFDGTNYQLTMTSDTGEDNQMVITPTTTTGDLSAFEYDPVGYNPTGSGVTNLTQSIGAVDASVLIDGVNIVSSSNTISSAISDVSIELVDAGTSTLNISQNTSGIGSAVQSFVDGYNELMTSLNEASAFSEKGQSGILIGDSTVRGIVSQMRSILNTTVGDSTTKYDSMASIGILTKRDGTLEYDASKLTTAISENVQEVQFLLAGGEASASSSIDVLSFGGLDVDSFAVDITSAAGTSTYSSTSMAINLDLSSPSLAGNLSFEVTIDGFTSGGLSINNQVYASGDDIATALQNAINADGTISGNTAGAIVNFVSDGGGNSHFEFMSAVSGSGSSISVNGTNTKMNSELGIVFGDTAGTVGTDAAGTIGGLAATFSGNTMTGSGDYSGVVLDISGASIGTSTITLGEGQIDRLDVLIKSILDEDGLIDAKTNGLNSSIADIGEARTALNERLAAYEARLLKQFNAMDIIVAQLNVTSNFLTNQLASLSGLANRPNK